MASEIVIARPDAETIKEEYQPMVQRAAALTVTNKDQHEQAQVCLRDLRTAKAKVRERLDPIISDAHRAHRGLTRLRSDLLKPIEAADRIVNDKIDAYEQEQRRKAEEARRAAEEAARKREEERRLMEAIEAEEAGDNDEAEQLLSEPIEAPQVSVEPQTAKVEGVSTQTRWTAEVEDKGKLVAYVAANPEWLHLLEPNGPALNGLARSQRGALNLPGVRAVPVTTRAVRTA